MATKSEGGIDFPSAAYAYVPDPETPSTWKLRLWESPSLKTTAKQVGMALAALGPGFRGNKVEIPANDLGSVKRKVLAAWKSQHSEAKPEEVPEVLKSVSKGGDYTMTVEELSKKLEEVEASLANVTKSAEEATKRAEAAEAIIAAGELIAKLSDEDREAYDAMPEEEQQAFVKADEDTRSTMLAKRQVAKSNTVPEEIKKQLDEITKRAEAAEARAAAAEEVAKSERDSRHLVELAKVAETDYAGLPGTAVEKALVLKSLEKLTPEEQAAVTKIFKSGNACLTESMKPVGKSGSTSTSAGGGAWDKIVKKAEALVSKDSHFTQAQAIAKVCQDEPALYDEYLAEEKK